MELFFSSLILVLFITSLISTSYFLIDNKNFKEIDISIHLLFGFSCLILLSHFCFFLFSMSSQNILIIFLVISAISFLLCLKKKNFFRHLIRIFLISLPIICIYMSLAYLYGEQFYVFRGNKWDWFAFVTSSFYLNNLEHLDFLSLKNNFTWSVFDDYEYEKNSAYHNNIVVWILKVTNISLLGSFFLNLKFNSPFFNLYVFKIFSLILINISIIDFLRKFININKEYIIYFLSFIFVSSFWTLYLFEADYYRQLISFGFFIYLISNLDQIFFDFENKNYKKIIIFVFFIYSLFILYPELLFVYFLFLFLSFLLFQEKIKFLKKNIFYLLLSFSGLVIIVFASYELILTQLIGQLKSTAGETRWWTYFGAFLFGRSSPALDIEFSNFVKNLIYNTENISSFADNVSFKDILSIITSSLNAFNYESAYFSIIPSLLGFYFITDLFKFDNLNYLNIIFLFALNIYFLFIVSRNLYFTFIANDKKSLNLKIFLIIIILFSIILILNGKLWTFIKFYMYMSPLIFLFVLFNFSVFNKNIIIKPNYFLVFVMSTFLIYKFYTFNYGIGHYDSFPSIQKEKMKKEIIWKYNKSKYDNCKKVILKFNKWNYYDPTTIVDRFKSIYLTLHLLDNNFIFESNFILVNQLISSDKICEASDL